MRLKPLTEGDYDSISKANLESTVLYQPAK
jgi:hypothetical protein